MRRIFKALQLLVFLAVLGAGGLLAVAFAPTLFGSEALIVTSGSMGDAMPTGSVAVTRLVDARAVAVGDIVSYRTEGAPMAVTHRVIRRSIEDGSVVLTTKGDANPKPDAEPIVVSARIHRVERVVPFAGTIVRHARSGPGGVVLFLVPIIGLTLDRRARRPRRRRLDLRDIGYSASTLTIHALRAAAEDRAAADAHLDGPLEEPRADAATGLAAG